MNTEGYRRIQTALAGLGFSPGPIDAISGPKTTAAIRAFQKARGLRVDGIVGPRTRAALGLTDAPVEVPAWLPWMREAYRLLGTRETRGRGNTAAIMAWAEGLELSQYTGDDIPWCGLFVAHCLRVGLPQEPQLGKWDTLRARAYERSGLEVIGKVDPRDGGFIGDWQFGDICTFWRISPGSGSGHVGFVVGETPTHWLVLGGNQSDSVSIAKLAKMQKPKGSAVPVARLTSLRRPLTAPERPADAPALMAAAGGAVVSTNEA